MDSREKILERYNMRKVTITFKYDETGGFDAPIPSVKDDIEVFKVLISDSLTVIDDTFDNLNVIIEQL